MADLVREAPALLQPAVEKARESADQLRRSTELRQVALGLISHATDFRDRLPTSLEAIRPYLAPDDAVAWRRLMLTADGRPRWVLALPGARLTDVADPSRTMLAYEAFTAWPVGGIAVAFVDGHVERIETRAEFERLVAALPKPRAPAPTPPPPAVKSGPAKR
jgi:prepilin-type processing-associated H-X9-DG protein